MIFENEVSWENEVLPEWMKAAKGAKRPNSDVWGPFPLRTIWHSARIESGDVEQMYLVGSSNLKTAFGTYRLKQIAAMQFAYLDPKGERKKVLEIQAACNAGQSFERPILVAPSIHGPFVILDGNHRTIAFARTGSLAGRSVYIGIDKTVTSIGWVIAALRG